MTVNSVTHATQDATQDATNAPDLTRLPYLVYDSATLMQAYAIAHENGCELLIVPCGNKTPTGRITVPGGRPHMPRPRSKKTRRNA